MDMAINSVLSGTPTWIDKLTTEAISAEREVAQIYEGTQRQGAIGIQLRDDGLVCNIKPGSSAEKLLAISDIVTAIDGVQTKDLSFAEMVELMKGPAGSSVCLDITRFGIGTLSVNLTRVAALEGAETSRSENLSEDVRPRKPVQCGLGFNLNSETRVVDAVTYAAYWGLRKGDELLNVDGHKLCEKQNEEIFQILIGDEGKSSDVLLKRVDRYGSYLVFLEIIRKAEHGSRRFEVEFQNSNQISRALNYEGTPLLSLANSVGGILSGWLGKAIK